MRKDVKVSYEEIILPSGSNTVLDVFGTQFKGPGENEYTFLFMHVEENTFNRETVEKELPALEEAGVLVWKYMGTYDYEQQYVEYGYGNDAIVIRRGKPAIV